MPSEQSFDGEWFGAMLCGIQHDFNDAFHVTINRSKYAYVHSQATRYGRSHLVGIEALPFDLTRLNDILG
jgi:hypothetical protein